jgi:4-amino-4-deoxy-L-arabinose transferase-like glycosyltransferase
LTENYLKQRKPKTENRKPLISDWPFLLGLALVGLVLFGYRLGAPGLMDPDEGRYAEIAREFFVLKDWLIPHLNLLPYLEKPPLVYWLTALSFKVLGLSEAAARLPSAVSALAGVFLAYGLGRTLWGPTPGVLGALVLATCAGYVALGRLLTLDMTFALFLNLGIGLGYLALSRGRPRLWPWAYVALGLAVLTKGPVALVLAGLIWGIGVLFPGGEPGSVHPHPSHLPSRGREQKEGTSLRTLSSPPPQPSPLKGEGDTQPSGLKGEGDTQASPIEGEGVKGRICSKLRFIYQQGGWRDLIQPWSWLLLAVLTLPWFVYVQWRYPEFFRFFILEQHFGRFLTPAIHPEPLAYYIPVLLGLLLPWTWLLPWALKPGGRWRDPDYRFLVIWAMVILGFFSLSRGKLVPYILPALMPLALLLGHGLAQVAGSGRLSFNRGVFKTSLLVWAMSGIALVALNLWPPAPLAQALVRANLLFPFVLSLSLIWALTPLAALIWRHLGALVLGALLLAALVPLGLDQVSQGRSFKDMGRMLKSRWQPGAALVGVQLYSQGLSFYGGHIFHLLGCRTELDFGERLAPEKGLCLTDKAALPAFTATRPLTFFFLKVHDLAWLQNGLPGKFRQVASHKDCILVAYERK